MAKKTLKSRSRTYKSPLRDILIVENGREFLPAKAIPLATGGVFDERTVLNMLAGKEVGLTARAYEADGRTLVPPSVFLALVGNGTTRIPDGILVPFERISWLFETECIDPCLPIHSEELVPWLDLPAREVPISDDDYAKLTAGVNVVTTRANSKALALNKYRKAFVLLSDASGSQGPVIDKKAIPGTKNQLMKILTALGAPVVSDYTFDEYKRDLGWTWCAGAKAKHGESMIDAVAKAYPHLKSRIR